MNPVVRILLAPFTLLYGMGIGIRNFIYDSQLLKPAKFSLPVIGVGNLTVGGEGKTPHVEYLITLFQDYLNVATLSRGYKRKTKGFRFVLTKDLVATVGDEPLQFKKKYPNTIVAVSESRALAIPEIVKTYPNTQLIILDDSYQHLSVEPSLNILLTNYSNIFTEDYLLPSGRLREFRSGYKRADVIIVSKCPSDEQEIDKNGFLSKINPLPHQSVYFTYYQYGTPYFMYGTQERLNLEKTSVVLVSAIANTDYLLDYVTKKADVISNFKFEDHHYFSSHEVSLMHQALQNSEEKNTILLTTEKDATRFHEHRDYILQNKIPIFILPVKVAFHYQEGDTFDASLRDFLLDFKV